jgi:hypothetical protein
MTRLLGLPAHCGAPVVLDHFQPHHTVRSPGLALYSSEPVFLCLVCWKRGHREDFDERAREIDHLLDLPLDSTLYGRDRRGKAWQSAPSAA